LTTPLPAQHGVATGMAEPPHAVAFAGR
jgi:hypothetical protein